VAEWLGEEGDRFRRANRYARSTISEEFKAEWASFLAQRRNLTLDEVKAKADDLQRRFERALAEGLITLAPKTGTRRTRRKAA
jgi:hypothetical protein